MEDLEGIMLREISHMEKRQISYDLAHMQNIKNKQKSKAERSSIGLRNIPMTMTTCPKRSCVLEPDRRGSESQLFYLIAV